MKKETKQGNKLLPLRKETMKVLCTADLQAVAGGTSSCYKPPLES